MKKHTFIVEISDTKEQSWQGSIEWVQTRTKRSFRSAMELLRLIESALDEERNAEEQQ